MDEVSASVTAATDRADRARPASPPPTAAAPAAGVTSYGPWRTALRQLRRNRAAMASLAVSCSSWSCTLLAPVYAGCIAHTDPFASNVAGTTVIGGQTVPVIEPSTTGLGLGVTPIGPTWDPAHYFLGADNQGRDVMARLLYGGRNSLLIGGAAALLCCVLATLIGLVAGFFGGVVDMVLSRLLDVLWAFPVYLLAISLSIVLLTSGIASGPSPSRRAACCCPSSSSASIYVPYVARPIRGPGARAAAERVRRRRHRPRAPRTCASCAGTSLPNVVPTVDRLRADHDRARHAHRVGAVLPVRSACSRPDASWGTIIQDGPGLLYTRPWVRSRRASPSSSPRAGAQRPRRRRARRARPPGQAAGGR